VATALMSAVLLGTPNKVRQHCLSLVQSRRVVSSLVSSCPVLSSLD
jgi:hypothetical protein